MGIFPLTKLFLRLFIENTLAEDWVVLRELDLTLDALLVFARPDDMGGFRRLEPKQTIL